MPSINIKTFNTTGLKCKLLLNAGAKLNLRDTDGYAALHVAAEYGTAGTPENVTVLLKAGADTTLLGCEVTIALELAKGNPKVKGSEAYWLLNDALYENRNTQI